MVSPPEIHDQLGTTLMAPMTSQGKAAPLRVSVSLAGKKSLILLDQLRAVDKTRRVKKLGVVFAKNLHCTMATLQEVFAP